MMPSQCGKAAQVIANLWFNTDMLIDQSHIPLEIIDNKLMLLESAIHCINQISTMTKQQIISSPFDAPPFPFTPDLETNKCIIKTYMDMAAKISLQLAPLDNPNKAFILKQCGVILRIELNTKTS